MPTTVFDLLDREWERLAHDDAASSALRAWGHDEPALSPFVDLAELADFTRSAPPPAVDAVLGALARRAPVDALAARVLLQLLLPGCRGVARRLASEDADAEERAAVVVASAYRRIRSYPADRRPVAIAPNVILDTAKWARRALRAGVGPLPDRVAIEELAETPCADTSNAAAELLEILADAVRRGVVDPGAARIVALTRIADEPIVRLAAAWQCHPGSLRRRRGAAEAALEAVA